MSNTIRFLNLQSNVYNIPDGLSKVVVKKEMLNGFILVPEGAFGSTYPFLLTKLSLVKITPQPRYHKKISIFRGSLSFHK
jgi:hypothetical protein